MNPKFTLTEKSKISRSIEVEIPRDIYNKEFNTVLTNTASNVKMKGFRPGHAPKALVQKLHGKAIHDDIISSMLSKAYQNAVEEHELRVVGSPEIQPEEVKDGQDFIFKIHVDVVPEPEVKDYFEQKIKVEVEPETCSDEQLKKNIDELLERFATFEPVTDRTVSEKGDVVNVDYLGKVDGEEFKDSKRTDVTIELGAGKVVEEIEAGLIGAEVDVPKAITMKLSDDLQDKKLAGKDAEYEVVVRKIQKKVLPELTDEFVKTSGMADDVEGLHARVKEAYSEQTAQQNKQLKERKLFERLIEKNEFEVPQSLIDEEIRELLFEMGMLDRSKQESFRMDISRFREPLGSEAEFRVRRYVVSEQIIKQEAVEVDDAQLEVWVDAKVAEVGRPKNEVEKAFGLPDNVGPVKKMLAREKIVEQLLEKNEFITKKNKK